MKIQIGYPLSPLAQAYVASRDTMFRDSERTCGPETLRSLLQAHGLPMSHEITEFEENLGGWRSGDALSAHGFGVYLALEPNKGCSIVATKIRKQASLFEGKRDEPDADGVLIPLWGTGYPRAFFQNRALAPAGMLGADVVMLLGEGGEVYLWLDTLGELLLPAASGRTFLEHLAP